MWVNEDYSKHWNNSRKGAKIAKNDKKMQDRKMNGSLIFLSIIFLSDIFAYLAYSAGKK